MSNQIVSAQASLSRESAMHKRNRKGRKSEHGAGKQGDFDVFSSEKRHLAARTIRRYLKQKEFHFIEEYDEESETTIFFGPICSDSTGPVDVFNFRIRVDEEQTISYIEWPMHVPDNRRHAIADLAMIINWTLKDGKVIEDTLDDGELVFQLTTPTMLFNDHATEDILFRLIGWPMCVVERFTPGILSVLVVGENPRRAYRSCCHHERRRSASRGSNDKSTYQASSPKCSNRSNDRNGGSLSGNSLGEQYSLKGLNVQGSIPLEQIIEAVRNFHAGKRPSNVDAPRLNLLLSGPPGCGKTAFVHHLAHAVGMSLRQVRASELLSRFPGETETRIADAFKEAKKKNEILFLDELDSVLQDRSWATHSWEISQVNEILQQSESFEGVMVGATNYLDRLDKAILRRFTYKIKLDYLTADGACEFFERYFRTPLSPEEKKRLSAIENLCPADFRTVAERNFYLPGKQTNDMRLDALEEESRAKGLHRNKIGF